MSDFSSPGSDDPSQGGQTTPPAIAGWYDDPWDPTAQRWWDGNVWTASTVRSNPGQDSGRHGNSGEPDMVSNRVSSNGLSEISEWVGTVFRTAIGRAGHVFPIMMVTVLPSALLTAVFGWLSIRDARINNISCLIFDEAPEPGCASFSGGDSSYVVPLLLAALWWLLGTAVFHLAIAHQLHGALDEQQPTWLTSLRTALHRLPRFIAYAVGTLLVVGIAYAVSIAVGAAAGAAGAAFVGLLWIPLVVFLWIKLSFLTVAAAVAPPKTNLLSASSSVSDGRFAAILGRLCVLVLLSIAVFIGSQAISFPLGLIVGPGINEGLVNDIRDEGRVPDSFAVVDLVTNPMTLALSLVLINVITSAVVATLQTAGTAALYRETGGPRRDDPETTPLPAAPF